MLFIPSGSLLIVQKRLISTTKSWRRLRSTLLTLQATSLLSAGSIFPTRDRNGIGGYCRSIHLIFLSRSVDYKSWWIGKLAWIGKGFGARLAARECVILTV